MGTKMLRTLIGTVFTDVVLFSSAVFVEVLVRSGLFPYLCLLWNISLAQGFYFVFYGEIFLFLE
jgi:hypothetical protein